MDSMTFDLKFLCTCTVYFFALPKTAVATRRNHPRSLGVPWCSRLPSNQPILPRMYQFPYHNPRLLQSRIGSPRGPRAAGGTVPAMTRGKLGVTFSNLEATSTCTHAS